MLSHSGLFHAVIEESGCDTSFWAVNWPQQQPWNYTKQTATRVNCTTVTDEEMISCMKQVDEWDLHGNSGISCAVCQLIPHSPHCRVNPSI